MTTTIMKGDDFMSNMTIGLLSLGGIASAYVFSTQYRKLKLENKALKACIMMNQILIDMYEQQLDKAKKSPEHED